MEEVPALSPLAQLDAYLQELHETYVEQVNLAVSEGRENLALELADDFSARGLRALAAAGVDAHVEPDVDPADPAR